MDLEAVEETTEVIEAAVEEALVETGAAAEDLVMSQEKCTRLLAQSAERNAKFHSSPQKENLYTAETALEQEDNSKHFLPFYNFHFFIFFKKIKFSLCEIFCRV